MYMMISTPHHHRIRISDPAMPPGCFVPSPGPPPVSTISPPSPCMPRTSPSPRMRKLMLTLPLAGHMIRATSNRRHSWHPGAVQCRHPQCGQRSVSLETLDPGEMEKVQCGSLKRRDPRRAPITDYAEDLESLLSLTEEEEGSGSQLFSFQDVQSSLQNFSISVPSLCFTPSERHPSRTKKRPHSHAQAHSSLSSLLGGSTQSLRVDAKVSSELWDSKETTEGQGVQNEESEKPNGLRSLVRSLSFLGKMARNYKNKEKERMKEREKEAREREARYSNGHLFTSLTVSATTLCSACNKSITAKEALSCPTCNVTIHNRCRDTLANCAKMKQKQQKLGRNSSALQNVALRNKTPIIKERPSSAIYPSDSLRQSLLGSRRGRSTLSLSKSVSTNNIAGNLNDDSPLGLRRILSQSTDSLNFRNRAMSMESLNDDGEVYYASMLEELEREGRDFEADSWSLAVDASYLQTHRKDIIKRQDVIYELIQTELHHVRTLRIMEGVFRRGMLEEVLLEPGVVHAVFPCLDQLVALHSRFVGQLLSRRNHSLAQGSTTNFTIQKLGDVLVEQFSGQNADEMRKCYAEFCSRHLKAVKLYKELLARDKRFQNFIRRVSRGSLLRRHGVQECILLVTQRITKYPVLIQRILDNTKGSEEEAESLSQALALIRELLSSVDQQVQELELTQKLQEIRARLDPRAETEVRGGGVFRGGELLRRRLLHEGTLLLKTAQGSRLKDVQVLLMTDILVFMQEKDQKYFFPCLDKPSVLSLQNLIVRDIANQERGMFLISDSTPPEMYELHGASKEDRNNWMKIIQQAVSRCPSRDDFPLIETEDKALLRRLRADIQQKDREVLELLQERVTLFSDLAEVTGGQEVMMPTSSRNMFRADTPHALQAEKLLNNAIAEVDRLSELLLGSSIELPQSCSSSSDQNHTEAPMSNGETISINGTHDGNSPSQKDRNGNQLQDRTPNEEVCQRLVNLSTHLHALQGAVIRQDSILELCMRDGSTSTSCSTPSTSTPSPLGSAPLRLSRSLSRDALLEGVLPGAGADQALLQRHYALLHDEVCRLRPLESRLRESERARAQLEAQLRELQGTHKRDSTDTTTTQRRGSDGSHTPLAPLACQEADQLDGVQEGSEEEDSEEEGEVRISPRSDSPRDLQDIPEESECITETPDGDSSHS
ncbi:rho guanine nucleotide exchange factor 2 isoform X1 [Tachysurus vachellii]|uniref:rho guanine nucleotide exchange factor 2 isoform X1 n=1 Tax=Tachysurus vachellii TaxID=175792 RepID=UPI00296AD29E|nr:rho guanine nucleotide exchange factor 2 isoform X1 [Tachysurus vachellii]XP_060730262.1 rho guanine nucleotide exchange factor 2 isoform X1 [Tachysurus vachellii]